MLLREFTIERRDLFTASFDNNYGRECCCSVPWISRRSSRPPGLPSAKAFLRIAPVLYVDW